MGGYLSLPLLGYNLKLRLRNFIVWAALSLCVFILIVVMFMNLLNAGLPDFINDTLASLTSNISVLPDLSDFGIKYGICMQIMLIVGSIYACYLGASANSSSRGDNDITFIYSMPVSRICTVLTSYTAQVVTLFFYNLIVFLVSLAVIYSNNKMDYIGKIALAVLGFMLVEIVYLSLSFLFSTFMNNGSQASSIAAVTVTLTLVFALIGSLAPALKIFTCLSPYAYISVYAIVSGQSKMFFIGIVGGIIVSLISVALSCARYNKIDFILD